MEKVQIIPTVFALDKESFDKKLNNLKFSKKLHLDFMDGVFTKSKSFQFFDLQKVKEYENIFFEVHLMAYNPISYLEEIKEFNIKKVLVQFEVFKTEAELNECVFKFRENCIEIFLVINPQTEVGDFLKFVSLFDGIMFMSVVPGREGQKFIVYTLEKIRLLRMFYLKLPIQIDGGVNYENLKNLVKSGVNIISVGSYISGALKPEKNFEKLEKIANK